MIFTLTACGAKANDSMMEMAPSKGESFNGMYDGEYRYEDSIQESKPTTDGTIDTNSPTQKLIKTYNFNFETTDYDKSLGFINTKIKECNGYIEKSETYGKNYRNSSMIIRIPEDKIDLFLESTGDIGEIIYKSESAEDITLSYYDLESKIETLEIQYDRILEILKKADNLSDIITLEKRLSEIQSELNTYNTRLNVYDNLVNYVTINLELNEVSQIQVVEEDSFFDEIKKGLVTNLSDIFEAFTDLAIWFITGIPYFIIWGVIIFVVIKVVKKIIKKKTNKKEQKKKIKNEE
jgi:large-conductance mechanosensitive channel